MPERREPFTRTSPEDGCNSPAATLSRVDLPQPVGPTTETNSPAATARVVSLTAVYRSPLRSRDANAHVTWSSNSAGACPGVGPGICPTAAAFITALLLVSVLRQ